MIFCTFSVALGTEQSISCHTFAYFVRSASLYTTKTKNRSTLYRTHNLQNLCVKFQRECLRCPGSVVSVATSKAASSNVRGGDSGQANRCPQPAAIGWEAARGEWGCSMVPRPPLAGRGAATHASTENAMVHVGGQSHGTTASAADQRR